MKHNALSEWRSSTRIGRAQLVRVSFQAEPVKIDRKKPPPGVFSLFLFFFCWVVSKPRTWKKMTPKQEQPQKLIDFGGCSYNPKNWSIWGLFFSWGPLPPVLGLETTPPLRKFLSIKIVTFQRLWSYIIRVRGIDDRGEAEHTARVYQGVVLSERFMAYLRFPDA